MEAYLIAVLSALGSLARATEFWSAIVGAIVGGLIAYFVQIKALHEGRKQREDDHARTQRALGNSLLFKMIRIHTDFYRLYQHFEECFEGAARKDEDLRPWQVVRPLANPPDMVHFSSEEMGMLLSLKHDDVFNLVVSMDVIHNSLNSAMSVMSTERRALVERIPVDKAEGGQVFSAGLHRDQMSTLEPRMYEVDTLIGDLRARMREATVTSLDALERLNQLLGDKLGLAYKLQSEAKLTALPEPARSDA